MNETLKRTISGAIYVILLLSLILYSTESFFVLFGVFLLIAVFEFCNLIQLNKIYALIISSIIYFIFYKTNFKQNELFTNETGHNLTLAALIITLIVSIKCLLFLFEQKNTAPNLFSKYVYLIGYIILPFVFITKIPFGEKGYNPKIIISIFILIWTNDTFAFIVGKSIGKNKLFEKVSPKKTIEGFIGGVLFAVIASYIISRYYFEPKEYYFKKSVVIWMTIAIIVGVFGTIGDLVESKFKRIAGVKDSGNIMPGHGGILDRLDSVIFVAPVIFLFYQILNYVS
ncbi:phosphatidate cytidylyltransferase [Flavobacterium sp.]|uniref:phosphatidate cytidylyltransferase n=1 Tax=Flavobacterium sp. TaxID=239 RepID=UPI00286B96FE|nr:phosphatidate cytidylyltransferase [Flavobacterium sp.]